jgi:3-hydroxymyristoyl/3-hydroxydecanoyl-(acyl carrier protein) dehydratase
MMNQPRNLSPRIYDEILEILAGQAGRASALQGKFLEARQNGLWQIAELVRMEAGLSGATQNSPFRKPELFTRKQLEEFAVGSVEDCLGLEYAQFSGRRVPRIPNGRLLLMDRVVNLSAMRGRFDPGAEIETELDIPEEAWFFQDQDSPDAPFSVLMEMALQPCGFLSAYLGSVLLSPRADLYFRNLDGEAALLRSVNLRNQVITARARLQSHTLHEETVIQNFFFQLSCGGRPFFEGHSIFGFFPGDAMARQAGLDGGKESPPAALDARGNSAGCQIFELPIGLTEHSSELHLSRGLLALLDEVCLDEKGGKYGNGYVYGKRAIRPEDWYFENHFFQDPVMPGSLGIEAILEAMRVFAIRFDLGKGLSRAHFGLPVGEVFNWRYRGQILPSTSKMQIEVHIRQVKRRESEVTLIADGSLWAGSLRIYEVKNMAIRIA